MSIKGIYCGFMTVFSVYFYPAVLCYCFNGKKLLFSDFIENKISLIFVIMISTFLFLSVALTKHINEEEKNSDL